MTRLNDPSNAKVIRKKVVGKQYVSTCNVCGFGVYSDDEWKLYGQPVTGICHVDCVQRLVAEAVLSS